MRGRKPKPAALQGARGRRRLGSEPQPPAGAVCPEWLSGAARTEWERVAPILESLGLLTKLDTTALAGYCACYAEWCRAQEFVQQNGQVLTLRDDKGAVRSVVAAPEVGIAVRMLDKIRQFAGEFGMTPSARGRIEVIGRSDSGGLTAEARRRLLDEVEETIQKLEGAGQLQ
ncbi:MAG: phage terminase small subunit P27 family [Bryobacteraceae bacterium]